MQILKLQGTDKTLYKLVAPLVMDPKVLRQNNNFPFRTSERFEWYIAMEGNKVMGFVPVEDKAGSHSINNYYIKGKSSETLRSLLKEVIAAWNDSKPLSAQVFMYDKAVFEELGFHTEIVWTRYLKMWKDNK